MQKNTEANRETFVQTRMKQPLLGLFDEFRRGEPDLPTRPEAARRLIERALNERQNGHAQ